MKAAFFRNMPNYDTLCEHTVHYAGNVVDYRSIANLNLEKCIFEQFCKDFKTSYDFLLPFVDDAVILHGIWYCVSVGNAERKLLVVMNHYQYPRYIAMA